MMMRTSSDLVMSLNRNVKREMVKGVIQNSGHKIWKETKETYGRKLFVFHFSYDTHFGSEKVLLFDGRMRKLRRKQMKNIFYEMEIL